MRRSDHAFSPKPASGLVCAEIDTSNVSSRKRGDCGITASSPADDTAVCVGMTASVTLPADALATSTLE